MKKFIMATVIAACIALCAAVWPQSKVVKETHVPSPTPAVCATEAAVASIVMWTNGVQICSLPVNRTKQ